MDTLEWFCIHRVGHRAYAVKYPTRYIFYKDKIIIFVKMILFDAYY